jgi:hypothetical protein
MIVGTYNVENELLDEFLTEYILEGGLSAFILSQNNFSTKLILYEPYSHAEC